MKKKYSIENMIRSENDFSLEVYFGNMCNYNCSYCFDAYTRKKHWSNWNKEQTDKCLKFIDSVKTLYDVLEIKIRKPFSNFERTFYITLDKEGVYGFFVNTDNKCYDYQWYVGYSDCKNKTVLYMEVVKKLTMLLN